jgi:hypothetical protein
MLSPQSTQDGVERYAGKLAARPHQRRKKDSSEMGWGRALSAAARFAASGLLGLGLLYGDAPKPKLDGTWELDPAKSKLEHAGGAIELNVANAGGKLQLTKTVRPADGKEAVSKFDCAPGGPDCPYDEAGHKSKVSLWFQGSDLVILKTDGTSTDEVSQWTLKLRDPDTLEITVSHITPGGADETMVFGRKK